MEISAAWLLTIFLAAITVTDSVPALSTDSHSPNTTEFAYNEINTTIESAQLSKQDKLIDYARSFSNMKDILMQEIHTLDKDVSDDKVSI